MSGGAALDTRELLRLLVEQQATITQLQRLVIEHVLAEARPGAATDTTAALRAEPMPSSVPAPAPAEPAATEERYVASNEPETASSSTAIVADASADSNESGDDTPADGNVNTASASEATPDPPVPADSPLGETPAIPSEVVAVPAPVAMPTMTNSRVSRYLKGRPVAVAKQVSNQELHRISRLCDVGDAAHLVLNFGEYRGTTLFQVAQIDPDYIRSLAIPPRPLSAPPPFKSCARWKQANGPSLVADRRDRHVGNSELCTLG
jgi:hypothetical protein